MTRKFASIELARLYEAQGYLKDALAMYSQLDDDVLEGGAEVRAAVKRLELAILKAEDVGPLPAGEAGGEDPAATIFSTLEELRAGTESDPPVSTPASGGKETGMAGLMEDWLSLMVLRKRLQLFKRIRARV